MDRLRGYLARHPHFIAGYYQWIGLVIVLMVLYGLTAMDHYGSHPTLIYLHR